MQFKNPNVKTKQLIEVNIKNVQVERKHSLFYMICVYPVL